MKNARDWNFANRKCDYIVFVKITLNYQNIWMIKKNYSSNSNYKGWLLSFSLLYWCALNDLFFFHSKPITFSISYIYIQVTITYIFLKINYWVKKKRYIILATKKKSHLIMITKINQAMEYLPLKAIKHSTWRCLGGFHICPLVESDYF